MKYRETHGGLMVTLEPGDNGREVRRRLETLPLAGVNVTLEVAGDTAPDAMAQALSTVSQAGGRVGRVRAPRVRVHVPEGGSATPAQNIGTPQPVTTQQPVTAQQQATAQQKAAALTEQEHGPYRAASHRTVIVPQSLRSGFRQEYGGSVVVLGDVNPGVELVAGGDIIVMGALRGVAHAGAGGNEAAIVWARPIASAQIRIGDALARSPDGSSLSTMRRADAAAEAELARLQEGRIVISPAFAVH